MEQSLTGHGTAQCHELDPQDLKDSLPACLLGDGSEILPPTCSIVYSVHDCVCVSTNNSNVDNLAESECILDDSLCVLEPDPDQALNVIDIDLSESTYPPIKGRLKDRARFWEEVLQASPFVLKIVTEGYRLPFIQTPTPFHQANHASALREREFVEGEIAKLVAAGCAEELPQVPFICAPLSVVFNSSGKKRLVHDLRHVNKFLWKQKFKYEDMRTALEMAEVGDFMVSFDLKSGYHHIDIHPDFWKFLGFSWISGGVEKYYIFKVLPFGLATVCFVFTKVMRQFIKRWRGMGIRVVVYIDDGLGFGHSYEGALRVAGIVRSDLENAGWVLNIQKTRLSPFRVGIWLGWLLDLGVGCLSVPEERIQKLLKSIDKLMERSREGRTIQVRQLAGVVGQIIATKLALGNIVRLRTRFCYQAINNCRTWSDNLNMSQPALEELSFWKSSLRHFNGKKLIERASVVRVVYSDASEVAYGGYMVGVGGEVAHENWSLEESQKSSTWRELAAVERMLRAFATNLTGGAVCWFTDNQAVSYIVEVGSRKEELQTLAMAIFQTCLSQAIELEVMWVPRAENEIADFISKTIDCDDWSISAELFAQLDLRWGPHQVNRFADHNNCQLPCFNSKFHCPNSSGVNAFCFDWYGVLNWCCPPVCLIPRTIKHAKACKAAGTLVVPCWPSAAFWPIIYPDGETFAKFILEVVELPQVEGTIVPGKRGSSIALGKPSFKMLALRFLFH